jgi:DNA-binding NarL/FixJ family response regulator
MLSGVRSLLEDLFEVVVMVAEEKSLTKTIERIQPELAVVDVSFPVQGTDAVTMIHGKFATLPVIALSLHDEAAAVQRVMSVGARAYVLKRSAVTDLAAAIVEVRAVRTYVSPAAGNEN